MWTIRVAHMLQLGPAATRWLARDQASLMMAPKGRTWIAESRSRALKDRGGINTEDNHATPSSTRGCRDASYSYWRQSPYLSPSSASEGKMLRRRMALETAAAGDPGVTQMEEGQSGELELCEATDEGGANDCEASAGIPTAAVEGAQDTDAGVADHSRGHVESLLDEVEATTAPRNAAEREGGLVEDVPCGVESLLRTGFEFDFEAQDQEAPSLGEGAEGAGTPMTSGLRGATVASTTASNPFAPVNRDDNVSWLLDFLRSDTGADTSGETVETERSTADSGKEETDADEAPLGLMATARNSEPGDLRRMFVGNVLLTGDDIAVRAAEFDLGEDSGVFVLGDLLGEGGYGSVSIARHAHGDVEYALKKIKKEADEWVRDSAAVEMLVLARLAEKPNWNVAGAVTIDDRQRVTMPILMRRAHTDLNTAMCTSMWPLSSMLFFIAGAAHGLRHLHTELGISHNDVKPGNILVSFEGPEEGYVGKMADFGHCRAFGEEVVMGNPGFVAPEVLSNASTKAHPTMDVFSMAATFYRCCVKQDIAQFNMSLHEGLLTPIEKGRLAELEELAKSANVNQERLNFEIGATSRTLADGSFERTMLRPEKLNDAGLSPSCKDDLCARLPAYMANDPSRRPDMDSLCDFLLEIANSAHRHRASKQDVLEEGEGGEEEEKGGWGAEDEEEEEEG